MSRQAVLQALRSREGGYLSGEELSRQLGLSRTAIWKAVDALRKDGYQIEARTGLGYRLSAVPDALTVEEIRNAPVLHDKVIETGEMSDAVKSFLGISK